MRSIILFVFITVLHCSCKNKAFDVSLGDTASVDTTTTVTVAETTTDTVIKTSKHFKLNGGECFWQHQIYNGEIIMNLLSSNTNKLLLKHSDIYHPQDYDTIDYFETNNENLIFEDVNFDGFTDIALRSYGSMPMNDLVNIYLYNFQIGTYTAADDLSANRIIHIDKKRRRLTTSNEFRYGTDTIVHYFDKAGKIKYQDELSNYTVQEDTTWILYKTYRKIVDGETVKEKTIADTIKWE